MSQELARRCVHSLPPLEMKPVETEIRYKFLARWVCEDIVQYLPGLLASLEERVQRAFLRV